LKNLKTILEIEDKGDFDKAFDLYNKLYKSDPSNFEIWKHFYFFLWIAIEDASSDFQDRINFRQRLTEMYDEGKKRFQKLTEFKFIAGWTISIFPYEYGDYEDLEKEGKEMLRQAHLGQPDDKVYKMAYLGSFDSNKEDYKQAEIEANPVVLKTFEGEGLMNKYFKQVLIRKNEKA
jgi:tetratricopeptide (TPR) repeat protein